MATNLNINEYNNSDYESLLQFLYMVPVGLIQLKSDGEIVMINPLATLFLMP